jgi:hypothetical protein
VSLGPIISKLQTRLDNIDEKKEVFKQTYFLLCKSCFWCASYFNSKSVSIAKCPNCYNNKIERMPIPKVNLYKLGYSSRGDPYTILYNQLGDYKEK